MAILTWLLSQWRIVVPCLIVALLLGTIKFQAWRIEHLDRDMATLTAKASEEAKTISLLKASAAKQERIQKQAVASAAAASQTKGEIDEAINLAGDTGAVRPVLRDVIKRVSRPGRTAAGHNAAAAALSGRRDEQRPSRALPE
jgi:hypothetical protein